LERASAVTAVPVPIKRTIATAIATIRPVFLDLCIATGAGVVDL
jgi:hypothetical protein